MWVPWKPEIPDERRVELARHWLKFLGLEVTEERVTRIKRHVMLYHPLSPKGQVAHERVLRDKTPTRFNIERDYPQWVQRVRERDQAQGRELLSDPSVPADLTTPWSVHRLDVRLNERDLVVIEAIFGIELLVDFRDRL